MSECEQRFVKEAAAGHRDCFAELVRCYYTKVYASCFQATRNRLDAEDVAQEVFVKAFRALPTFRQECSFSSWLFRITTRTLMDYRKAHRTRGQPVDLEDDWKGLVRHPQTVEEEVMAKENRELVHALISGLSEPYRRVVVLHYLEQQSSREIAQHTGASVKTVESQLYRARAMMRQKGERFR